MRIQSEVGETLTAMTILRSAFPVRISYKHIVRSPPTLANTLVSD